MHTKRETRFYGAVLRRFLQNDGRTFLRNGRLFFGKTNAFQTACQDWLVSKKYSILCPNQPDTTVSCILGVCTQTLKNYI